MQIGRRTGCLSAPGIVSIGCEAHTLAYWHEYLDNVAALYHATAYEIALAKGFLVICTDVDEARTS